MAINIILLAFLLVIVAGIFYFLLWYLIRRIRTKDAIATKLKKAEELLKNAEKDAEDCLKKAKVEAKEELYQTRLKLEKEIQEKRELLLEQEKRVIHREKNVERKANLIDEKEDEVEAKKDELGEREEIISVREGELEEMIGRQQDRLEEIAGMTSFQAKEELKKSMEGKARKEMVSYIQRIEAEAKEKAEERSRSIVCASVNKIAGDSVIFNTVSVVELPNEEMKGRIIGREGRNIRSIEMATGIDVLVDNTPNAVVLSGFNPLRRELARLAIEKLVEDGRIHPARIEEMVEKAQEDLDHQMSEDGENLVFELDIHNLHPKLSKLLGKLKYKTDSGINLYQHSKDFALLAGGMAEELGLDVQLVRRAAVLHEIGHACDSDEFGGTILERTIDALSNYEESTDIINMVTNIHEHNPNSPESAIICAAHTISVERPGAFDHVYEVHVERLNKLESIATGFQGVKQAYAIRAGREIRVIVDSGSVSDDEVIWLSRDIAGRIESETEYSGQIKVVVIRQTRAFDIAT